MGARDFPIPHHKTSGRNIQRKDDMPEVKQLPTLYLNDKQYFFDARLKQLRHVDNPHEFLDLTKIECGYIRLLTDVFPNKPLVLQDPFIL